MKKDEGTKEYLKTIPVVLGILNIKMHRNAEHIPSCLLCKIKWLWKLSAQFCWCLFRKRAYSWLPAEFVYFSTSITWKWSKTMDWFNPHCCVRRCFVLRLPRIMPLFAFEWSVSETKFDNSSRFPSQFVSLLNWHRVWLIHIHIIIGVNEKIDWMISAILLPNFPIHCSEIIVHRLYVSLYE